MSISVVRVFTVHCECSECIWLNSSTCLYCLVLRISRRGSGAHANTTAGPGFFTYYRRVHLITQFHKPTEAFLVIPLSVFELQKNAKRTKQSVENFLQTKFVENHKESKDN